MVYPGMFSEVKGILSLEVLIWVCRAVADTSKNVKPKDKLLQSPKRESHNQRKNCGRRGKLQRHDIEIFCLTFLIKCLWPLLQEELEREISSFTFGFPRSLSSQECLHEYENTNYISVKIWSCKVVRV